MLEHASTAASHRAEQHAQAAGRRPDLAHRDLFSSAPIPIMVEDWSRVYLAIEALREQGVTDLDEHVDAHPDALDRLYGLHAFVEANDAVLELVEASSMAVFFDAARQLLPADRDSNLAVYPAMLEGRSACQGERTLVTFSGRNVPIVWRCSLPRDVEGYRRLCFYAFDVTEQKENSDRLQALRADMARSARVSLFGELSASILHEICQPLSAASTSADAAVCWLIRHNPDIAEAVSSIQNAARWARDATDICSKMRGFLGKVPVQSVRAPASRAIDAALFLVSPEASAKEIAVTRLGADDVTIFADPVQIQQVLANLLLNGIHAIDSNGSALRALSLSVEHAGGGYALFEVRDSGAGMSPDTLDAIFQPFFTTKAGGMGMGLAVARSIIEAHGGRIWVERSTPDGTCFRFTVPTTAAHAPD
ncbi:sensor histidine kinase [Burkholderia sp. Ac-20379]|uniref:sensor histidine kinase n=1 Tax=Burkholderia sp. Ac-20379 TaxID=2703900 RepID=UPI00197EB16F|nr:ATP-binding protein [Burkholderia sp. Ac-20379]MBN3724813.1 histidine kinase [Burkholderia sp. Ac-20379]